MKPPRIRVSDHAVLRYLERVCGWDVERLRGNLEKRIRRTAVPGCLSVVIDGARYLTRHQDDGEIVVVTVVEPKGDTTRPAPEDEV